MSSLDKFPAQMLDFQSSQPIHDPAFESYAQPQFLPNPDFFTDFSSGPQGAVYAYTHGPDLPQYVFADHHASRPEPRLREAPIITSSPSFGSSGSHATIYFQSTHDYFAPPTVSFLLFFGQSGIHAALEPVGAFDGPVKQYAVTGVVPPFPSTGSATLAVSFSLVIAASSKNPVSQRISLGSFVYEEPVASMPLSRKRKASEGSEYDVQPPKRAFHQQLQIQDRSADSFDDQTSPFSTVVPTPTDSGMGHLHARTVSPRPSGHQYSTSNASVVSLTAPSPHTPAYSPSFATVKTEQSPRAPMTPGARPASAASLKQGAPKLVRTSTMQSPSQASPAVSVGIATHSFNPYAMYPLKANLRVHGDLDAVAKDWSDVELDARRKLIEFTRTQSGSTINASFKTVAPEQRQQHNITISCIWWKEKKEAFVTSVDTIYLLEALVGVRFTVEEKNRIRRNLEGFRPLTVSKTKADSEEFFKVIMGFPHPKPRNIEKDVKVFPWKILSMALKKIIGKYSASYSSTASAMISQAPALYGPTESYDFPAYSSAHHMVATTLPSYPATTAAYSPSLLAGRASAPVTTAPMPELRLQMPTAGPTYSLSANVGFQPTPMTLPSHSSGFAPQAMSAPAGHRVAEAWDFASFVHESPVTAGPHITGHYSRGSIDTTEFITPTSYAMSHQ